PAARLLRHAGTPGDLDPGRVGGLTARRPTPGPAVADRARADTPPAAPAREPGGPRGARAHALLGPRLREARPPDGGEMGARPQRTGTAGPGLAGLHLHHVPGEPALLAVRRVLLLPPHLSGLHPGVPAGPAARAGRSASRGDRGDTAAARGTLSAQRGRG